MKHSSTNHQKNTRKGCYNSNVYHFHSIKTKIIFIIFSAVIVIVATSLAIETRITTKLYRAHVEKEIFATVRLNVNEVNRYTQAMEQKASELARAGEVFYTLHKGMPAENLDAEIEEYLVNAFSTFPEAIGGGIWFEPYTLFPQQKYYGPYAFWEKGSVVFTWDLNTPKYDYFTWDWYTLALPKDWNRAQKREHDYYWTPPYLDGAGTSGRMITVDAFMHDEEGTIIGISTADWSIENMLTFLKNSKITDSSETFLIDANSNTILANTLDSESTMKNATSTPWISLLVDPQKDTIKVMSITVGGTMYQTYYTLTDAGMFYGVLVPSKVISEATNQLLMVSVAGSIFVVLALVIVLYFALSTVTNSIVKLTSAVSRVAGGDLSANIKITTADETGVLGSGFNQMVETLSAQKIELENRTSVLEATVTERTKELKGKLDELERLNALMTDRELKMISLKEQVKQLEKNQGNTTGN